MSGLTFRAAQDDYLLTQGTGVYGGASGCDADDICAPCCDHRPSPPLKSKSLFFEPGNYFRPECDYVGRKQNSVLLHLQLFQVVAFLEVRDVGITFILIVFTM